jgi:hypothetical protein
MGRFNFDRYESNAYAVPKPDFDKDSPAKCERSVDRITIPAQLRDGRTEEVSFVKLVRRCAPNEILQALEEQGVREIKEQAYRDMRPKLGLNIGDEEWCQIHSLAPKMYGEGGIDMCALFKILVTRPDVAGKLWERQYRRTF